MRYPHAESGTDRAGQVDCRGAALALQAIGKRHRNEKLVLAAELANAFVDGPSPQPKPRVRKPKVTAPPEPTYADRKSAAAHDTRELAHHSV